MSSASTRPGRAAVRRGRRPHVPAIPLRAALSRKPKKTVLKALGPQPAVSASVVEVEPLPLDVAEDGERDESRGGVEIPRGFEALADFRRRPVPFNHVKAGVHVEPPEPRSELLQRPLDVEARPRQHEEVKLLHEDVACDTFLALPRVDVRPGLEPVRPDDERKRVRVAVLQRQLLEHVVREHGLRAVDVNVADEHSQIRREDGVDGHVAHCPSVERGCGERRLIRPRAARRQPHLVHVRGSQNLRHEAHVVRRRRVERAAVDRDARLRRRGRHAQRRGRHREQEQYEPKND
mmetsp:Transcript_16846/g.58642  ORF Transcript_16846/g.58642 Transcript_16846/m.58642 type:complete len:292 (+) Transcript_16846:224-1099(+)